ncbi:CD44 antigen isoform X9 [Notamacropus eugenii]|uniref:CD44 antigen isoform X9 n=1 Tax=Notamacropus eugenii TaxID=9315 RepID=UPI003B684166
MDKSWSRTIWGLFLVQLSLAQIELNITCRFAGVYHVEKNGRYSISRTEAADLCKAFNSTLPTLKQMEQALSIGFETCRYGFIDGHVVIPRKTPRFLCAANNTGVYILASNMSQYDTYCFNASAPLDKEDCSSVTDIPSTFEGQITIGIVNPDGTRYTKKGEYRTNPEDINPSFNPEDDGSSGSAGERSTMGGSTIIQTTYDDVTPTPFNDLSTDDDHEDFSSVTPLEIRSRTTQETTTQQQGGGWFWWLRQPLKEDAKTTAETTAQNTYPRQETTSQRQDDSWIGYLDPISHPMEQYNPTGRTLDGQHTEASTHDPMGGSTSFFSDFNEELSSISPSTSMNTVTSGVTEVTYQGGFDSRNEKFQTDTAPHHSTADPNEGWIEDKGTTDYPPMATAEQDHSQSPFRPHTGLDDSHKHSTVPSPTSLTDGDAGLEYGSLPEDSATPVEDSFVHFPGTKDNTANSSRTHMTTGLPGVTKPTVLGGFIPDIAGVPSDRDGSHAGQPHYPVIPESSTPSPDGNKDQSEQNPNLKRKAKIPEWLIILSALLALALILAVCIAVNSRRRCGQKKKLVINSGNGAVDDKKSSGLNGDASKSQEMVHLVYKEQSDGQVGQDECMTADETRNLQNVDMKIGV